MNQFPQAPDYSKGPFRIFSKIHGDIPSSRFASGVVDTSGKWNNLQSEKFIILLVHLWMLELTYIFAFKFTLRYLQPDIVPSVNDTGGKFATSVIDTGICHRYQQH